MNRCVVKAMLLVALLAALSTLVAALSRQIQPEALAVVAGSLAVVAALGSVWTGQRVVELQEDVQHPYPYPSFDFGSRCSCE